MGRADYYAPGDWNVTCFRCGRKRKSSELRKQWQGFYVCPEHWEPRHPQDYVKSVPDTPSVPWAQPKMDWNYVGPSFNPLIITELYFYLLTEDNNFIAQE